jgi:uncharacterized protein YqhQ
VAAIAIFFVSPLGLIGLINWLVDIPVLIQHMIEGAIRLGLFLGYVWAIGWMEDVKRVFGYHGAEHKAINAYEQGIELTPEKVAQCSIVHPRCGTAFFVDCDGNFDLYLCLGWRSKYLDQNCFTDSAYSGNRRHRL